MNDLSATLSANSSLPNKPQHWTIEWCENGWIPDVIVRLAMRRLLRERLRLEKVNDTEQVQRLSLIHI